MEVRQDLCNHCFSEVRVPSYDSGRSYCSNCEDYVYVITIIHLRNKEWYNNR